MRRIATTSLALLSLLALTASAFAEPNGSREVKQSGQEASNQTVLFRYTPSGECLDVFVAGSTLRHAPPAPPTATSSISVSAQAATTAVFAQLFWVVLADQEQPNTEMLNGVVLNRIACGPVTPSPCWAEQSAFAYRADVSGLIHPGSNVLTGFPDSGLFNVAPESEGATLVIVHRSSAVDKEIIITCGNDAIGTSVGNATLTLPVQCGSGLGADLYFIGADGQSPPPGWGDEVYWNGTALDAGDAWQGLDPGAGVGMWDSMTFGVSTLPANVVATTGMGDCINWVSTVLAVKCGGCQSVPVQPKSWGSVKDLYRQP